MRTRTGIWGELLEDFKGEMRRIGIRAIEPLSKGTSSVVLLGELSGKKVVVKLQRPDSPRRNLFKEAEITGAIEPFGITPPPIHTGIFRGLEYLVRDFVEGEPILRARVRRRHVFEITLKTATLDRLRIDHGQIQGGKHVIIGNGAWIIDFEKANWRKPKNLTSAMSMLFLGKNAVSWRIRERFGVDRAFLEELRGELLNYKRGKGISGLLSLLSTL